LFADIYFIYQSSIIINYKNNTKNNIISIRKV